jgi:hypothetical protein
MTINCITNTGHAFGKGEVVSSILTGSTIPSERSTSAIYFTAMPYCDHQDDEAVVLDGGNDPIVADAVAP